MLRRRQGPVAKRNENIPRISLTQIFEIMIHDLDIPWTRLFEIVV